MTIRGCRKRLDSQHTTVDVDHRGDIHIAMRVHPTHYMARRIYDRHGHPFLS